MNRFRSVPPPGAAQIIQQSNKAPFASLVRGHVFGSQAPYVMGAFDGPPSA